MQFVADTGTGISVISKGLYDTLNSRKPLQETKVQLIGASGETLKTLGKAILIISVADRTIDFPFFVVEGLKTEIILGNDIMKELGLSINLDLEIIKTPIGNWLPIEIYKPKDKEIFQIKTVEDVIIPAQSACLLRTEVSCVDNNKTPY